MSPFHCCIEHDAMRPKIFRGKVTLNLLGNYTGAVRFEAACFSQMPRFTTELMRGSFRKRITPDQRRARAGGNSWCGLLITICLRPDCGLCPNICHAQCGVLSRVNPQP